jgi:hypothetical protein
LTFVDEHLHLFDEESGVAISSIHGSQNAGLVYI